ncbi:MAG: AAC(3) family N-acetyltransferase [Planctomycetota bacterium]
MDPVTITTIRQAVRTLGLNGLPVCLHASSRSFGKVEGGPGTVVQGFLEEGCTVLVPAFSDDFAIAPPPGAEFRPPRNAIDYTLDFGAAARNKRVYLPSSQSITEKEMGALPAWVVEQPGRSRGYHPLCSFAGLGPAAAELIAPQTPTDVFAPLRLLSQRNGRVVLMGVGLDSMTLLHLAEQQAGRQMFVRWALAADGRPEAVRVGGCSNGFKKFAKLLAPFLRQATVGRSAWQAYAAPAVLRAAAKEIKANPEITACGNPGCERCRDMTAGGPE